MSQEFSAQTPIELCVIEGDGIGREVIPAAVEVLKMVAPDVIIRPMEAGWGYFQKHKTPLPDETIQVARECKAILFGAVSSPAYPVEGYFRPLCGCDEPYRLSPICVPPNIYPSPLPVRAWTC